MSSEKRAAGSRSRKAVLVHLLLASAIGMPAASGAAQSARIDGAYETTAGGQIMVTLTGHFDDQVEFYGLAGCEETFGTLQPVSGDGLQSLVGHPYRQPSGCGDIPLVGLLTSFPPATVEGDVLLLSMTFDPVTGAGSPRYGIGGSFTTSAPCSGSPPYCDALYEFSFGFGTPVPVGGTLPMLLAGLVALLAAARRMRSPANRR